MTLQLSRDHGWSPDDELVINDLERQQSKIAKTVERKRKAAPPHYSKEIGALLFQHLCEVANTTSVLLSPIVGAEFCAITIKVLWRTGDATVVHTLLRDAKSYRDRVSYEPRDDFDYAENTAFAALVSSTDPGEIYLSNNLRADAAAGKYKNSNNRWRDYYNCTAVVRINNTSTEHNVVGFLCADSWRWKSDPSRERLQDVLVKMSQHVYNTLELIVPEDSSGRKSVGFAVGAGQLTPVDEEFQARFQAILEAFRLEFDLDYFGHGRWDEFDAGRLPGIVQQAVLTEKSRQAMLAAAARVPHVLRLKAAVSKLSNQDIADRLKPIARRNPYARELLVRARKKGVVKQ
jgi:hypothetical protein